MVPHSDQREFIQAILKDQSRLDAVFSEAILTGVATVGEIAAWREPGRTKEEAIKSLLDRLEYRLPLVNINSDIGLLSDICHQTKFIRNELPNPDLWRTVFSRLSIPLNEPVSVEYLKQGRCNYTYRICGGDQAYVIRYHDPIGKEFLQRHDPVRAVEIYGAVEELMRLCLGRDGVVSTLSSTMYQTEATGGDIADVVASRSLIQRDYSDEYFALIDYGKQQPEVQIETVIKLYARPLALLHSRSRNIYRRERSPLDGDHLAHTFRRYRHFLRFVSPAQYGHWLNGPNWISRRVLSGLKGTGNHPDTWSTLLDQLGMQRSQFEQQCHNLWTRSAQAMACMGSLVHLDHNPRNCFVDRSTRTRIMIFDFDYVAITDPAYELGLSIYSLVKVIITDKRRYSAEQILAHIELYLSCYEEYSALDSEALRIGIPELPPEGRNELLTRARSFAGLALASTLEEYDPYREVESENSALTLRNAKQALLHISANLLSSISAVPAGLLDSHSISGHWDC